jgi:hypothetical protein
LIKTSNPLKPYVRRAQETNLILSTNTKYMFYKKLEIRQCKKCIIASELIVHVIQNIKESDSVALGI